LSWGTLAIGFFAKWDDAFLGREDAGLFYGGGVSQLVMQLVGVVIVAAWVLPTTGLLFFILKKMNMLRVSPEEEIAGLDVSEHGSAGYGIETTFTGSLTSSRSLQDQSARDS
jgi:Amt family ammonium transporter